MDIKIVTGIAGSGKSTYCKKLEAEGYRYIAHDKWVHEQFDDLHSDFQFFAFEILGSEFYIPTETPHMVKIDKQKFIDAVLNDDEFNHIFIDYFTSRFAAYINRVINMAKHFSDDEAFNRLVIEVPYLDHSISWMKRKHPEVEIVAVDTMAGVIEARLRARGWDENRIKYSFELYRKMMDTVNKLPEITYLNPDEKEDK